MKTFSILILLVSMCVSSFAAAVFPASTNGNNVFTGTNTFATLVQGNGAGLTNIPYDNIQNHAPDFGLQSWGRFSWTNVQTRIANWDQFSVMILGDGLTIQSPLEAGLGVGLFPLLKTKRTSAGFNAGISFPYFRIINTNCHWLTSGGDVYCVGSRAYLTNTPSSAVFLNDGAIGANVFALPYVKEPRAGTILIEQRVGAAFTNLVTLDASDVATNYASYRWTNGSALDTQIRVTLQTAGKTNVILMPFMWNTNIVGGFALHRFAGDGGVTWGTFSDMKPNLFSGYIAEGAPSVILCSLIPNPNDYTNMVSVLGRLNALIPHPDIVVCGDYPTLSNASPGRTTGASLRQQLRACQTNSWAFYDGWSPWIDLTNAMTLMGSSGDGVHPSFEGSYKWNHGLWSWLSWYGVQDYAFIPILSEWTNGIPTNLIPLSTVSPPRTNWILLNLGGIPTLVATNASNTPTGILTKALFP